MGTQNFYLPYEIRLAGGQPLHTDILWNSGSISGRFSPWDDVSKTPNLPWPPLKESSATVKMTIIPESKHKKYNGYWYNNKTLIK